MQGRGEWEQGTEQSSRPPGGSYYPLSNHYDSGAMSTFLKLIEAGAVACLHSRVYQ